MSQEITIKLILEAALLAAGEPLTVERMMDLFDLTDRPTVADVRAALATITEECENRPFTLKEIASGFCFQVKSDYAPWVRKLWEERPARYSRALLETLALIAYRQPITRAEIEEIRGVAVSTHTVKTLQDREWVRIVGHRDVPGKPALFATTKQFLDYFNLKSLAELPSITDLQIPDEADPLLQVEMAIEENSNIDEVSDIEETTDVTEAQAESLQVQEEDVEVEA